VHPDQIVETGTIPLTAHDFALDLIVTPDEVIRCPRRRDWSLPRLDWAQLTDEKVAAIPLLARLSGERA
jgi:5-formyltetrahydrofolate cyclo-ligase